MKLICSILLLFVGKGLYAQEKPSTYLDLPYYPEELQEEDSYQRERCVLDLYIPEDTVGFSTIVWFHGGGLKGGEKYIPARLKGRGVAIIAANYRLSPQVNTKICIQDAAAAVAWAFDHIEDYGGRKDMIFVSGHSAGGYLASMLGLDHSWLAAFGKDADQIAGLIPFSGHTITHFTVREEMGIPGTQPLVDEMAPLFFVRKDAPPYLMITGDRELELLGRYEENAYMMRMMKVVGHPETQLLELDGYGHSMTEPAYPLLLNFLKEQRLKQLGLD